LGVSGASRLSQRRPSEPPLSITISHINSEPRRRSVASARELPDGDDLHNRFHRTPSRGTGVSRRSDGNLDSTGGPVMMVKSSGHIKSTKSGDDMVVTSSRTEPDGRSSSPPERASGRQRGVMRHTSSQGAHVDTRSLVIVPEGLQPAPETSSTLEPVPNANVDALKLLIESDAGVDNVAQQAKVKSVKRRPSAPPALSALVVDSGSTPHASGSVASSQRISVPSASPSSALSPRRTSEGGGGGRLLSPSPLWSTTPAPPPVLRAHHRVLSCTCETQLASLEQAATRLIDQALRTMRP